MDDMMIIGNTISAANFAAGGPLPRTLYENAQAKVIVGSVPAGQQIPTHPEALAVYYFLQGEGWMTVGDERLAVRPGMTVVTPEGSRRGVEAESDLAFLAVRVAPLASA